MGMSRGVERKINEAYLHIKPYLDDEETTESLVEMCQNCECYCGEEHNWDECCDKACFRFWLAYIYLEWCDAYEE